MSNKNNIFKTQTAWQKNSYFNKKTYEEKYRESIENNEQFWAKEGKRIDWIKPYSKIKKVKYSDKEVYINWYYDGKLNASVNCIDRHLQDKGDKIAIIWESDDPNISKKITYKELHTNVCKTANGLKKILTEDGSAALSGFGCAKGSNEEAYLFQKFIQAINL